MKNLILITTLFLSACASLPDFLLPNGRPMSHYKQMTVEQISSKIQIDHDTFEQETTYNMPKIETWGSRYFIRGWKDDKTKKFTHQLYVELHYSGRDWKFYKSAKDSNKKAFELVSVKRKVNSCAGLSGCSYIETVGVALPSKYLKDHKEGLEIKIYAKNGVDRLIKVPAKYIQAYLSKVK